MQESDLRERITERLSGFYPRELPDLVNGRVSDIMRDVEAYVAELTTDRDEFQTLYGSCQEALREVMAEHRESEEAHEKVAAQNLTDFMKLTAKLERLQEPMGCGHPRANAVYTMKFDTSRGDDETPCGECGHPYRRHWDWGDADAYGCKYCDCPAFCWCSVCAEKRRVAERILNVERIAETLYRTACDHPHIEVSGPVTKHWEMILAEGVVAALMPLLGDK